MTRTLLAIAAIGAIVAVVSFGALHALGGLGPMFNHHGHGWRHGRYHMTADGDDGPAISRDLAWAGGDTLSVDYPAQITYTQGPAVKITVTGPKTLVDALSMDGGQLLGPNEHWGFMSHERRLTIAVTSPNTHVFRLAGVEDLTIDKFDQDSLDLHISGAGHAQATGRAKHATARVSGAGSLDLAKLQVEDANVHISGTGAATLDPKLSADISISGAGHVSLLTRPPTLHSSISGVGSISTP